MERASQQPGVKDEWARDCYRCQFRQEHPTGGGRRHVQLYKHEWWCTKPKKQPGTLLNKMATALCRKETKCLLVITHLCWSFISPFISEISPLYLEMSRSVSKLWTLLSIIITADSSTVYLSLHIKHKSSSHISFKVSTLGWGSEERKVLKSAYHL